MADLRELTTDAKRLYEAMGDLLAKQEAAGEEEIDFEEIWFSAKSRPFEGHILAVKDDVACRRYLTIMASMAALAQDREKRAVQIRFIARVLAACGACGVDLKAVVTDGMLLTEKSIGEFYELGDKELQVGLLMDLLLMCYLDGKPEEKQIDFAVGFMAVLGLGEDVAKAVGMAVKGILEQDDMAVLGQGKWIAVENLYCYLKNPPNGVLVHDIKSAMEIEAEKIIFMEESWDALPVIECDKFKADVIEFLNCSFNGCGGLKGKKNRIILKGCIFSDTIVEENFITLNYAEIMDCRFTNICSSASDEEYIFQLLNSKIENSIFEKVKIIHEESYACGGLLKTQKTTINKCQFLEVDDIEEGYRCSRNTIYMCEGTIYACQFKNCNIGRSTSLLCTSNDTIYGDLSAENISNGEWHYINGYLDDEDMDFNDILENI